MLAVFDMIREESKRIFNDGKKAGIKTGIQQNRIKHIKNMLKEKLPIDLITKITGASKEEIEKYNK